MEAKIKMMQQENAKDCQWYQKLRERLGTDPPVDSGRKALVAKPGPADILLSDFQPPELLRE